jgi:chitinase
MNTAWITLAACLGGLCASCAADYTTAPESADHRVCGWLYAEDKDPAAAEEAYDTFAAHASELDAVHPTWWRVASPTTFANHAEDSAAPYHGFNDPRVIQHTTAGGGSTLLMPMIGASHHADTLNVHRMINDPELRRRHVQALVALVTENGYDGIDLDYEHLDPDHLQSDYAPGETGASEALAFTAFVDEAARALHAVGKTLSLAVPERIDPPNRVFDFEALSRAADTLHVMAYDFHYSGGPHAGPVSPLGWVEAGVADILSVDEGRRASRFVLGLPNYGMIGPEVGPGGDGFAHDCEPSSACLALTSGTYETTTKHMEHCDQSNESYLPGRTPNKALPGFEHLFFEDLASLEEKVGVAARGGLGGVTLWGIGGQPVGPAGRTYFEMVRSYFPRR